MAQFKRHCCFIAALLLSTTCLAAVDIIPAPVFLEEGEGTFTVTTSMPVYVHQAESSTADLDIQEEAEYLVQALSPAMGDDLSIEMPEQHVTAPHAPAIQLYLLEETLLLDGEPLGEEGYHLEVNADGVTIRANHPAGIFYGMQTLRQLFPVEIFSTQVQDMDWKLPHVTIHDRPTFGWRGMHLDVGRHFMPVEFVKKYVDLIAMHRMNRFHWHLTEDQGWRIEIKKYPLLTEIGAWRDETLVGHYHDGKKWFHHIFPWIDTWHQYDGQRYGGFYTQDEIREVVEYARRRHVHVVPEIEMPGHAQAAVVAYPELSSSNEKIGVKREWGISEHIYNPEEHTIEFLKDVMSEVLALFPSEFIHIGGDEAHKDLWEKSVRIQQCIRERGLKNEDEMQSWFIKQFDVFLTGHGRRLIGWDEILEGGLAEGAAVMSWRGDEGGIAAARAGHDVVMADYHYTYFDYYQSKSKNEPLAIGGFLPLEEVYAYDPIPKVLNAEESRHILGAQGQLWTEYMKTPEHVEYMAFPRLTALAEVVWLNQERDARDYQAFLGRLEVHNRRLDFLNVNYRPLD